MEWTKEDRDRLLSFKTIIDNDNIKIKQKIKKILLNNKYIIHTLNNKELEMADAEPDDYFGVNILDYYMVAPAQSKVDNFLCFTTNFDEVKRYDSTKKYQQITFSILCHNENLIDKDTGIARHDLIGALIMDQFDYTNYFGTKIHCISDKETIVDNDYATRVLIFQQLTDNNLVKTLDGVPRLINKDIIV